MTPSVASAKSAVAVAGAVLLKAGFDPNQLRGPGGEWTTEGGGAARYSGGPGRPTTGAETRGYPYTPSRKELEMEAKHTELAQIHRAMVNGGTPARDPDLMEVETALEQSAHQLRAKKAMREADLAAARQRAAQNSPPQRPAAANAAANEQQARMDRRTEAERIQAAHARLNRERQAGPNATSRAGLSDSELKLLQDIENASATASAAAALAGGGAGTFRGALRDTTARLARSIKQMHNILGNVHGIASTTDYSLIGRHLNFIRDDISSLQRELKELPASAREMRAQTVVKLRQAKAKADELQQRIKERVSRLRRSRRGT